MHRYILLIVLAFFLVKPATAKIWQVAEGRYATVEYQPSRQALADSLLKIAELSIPRLANIFDLSSKQFRDDRVRIILTAAPDISNGYAIGNTVVIYALSSMYMELWTGDEPWYKQVLTHELAHYVTFRKLQRKLNMLGAFMSLTVPRWFYEGTAQYYSEKWNAYRGNLYLKNALFSGKLNYDAMENLGDGRLLYATAHGFVRHLADQYGDSSLVEVMAYKKDDWVYDFDEAFESVFGKSPEDLFPEFIRRMVLYYGDKWADYPVSHAGRKLPAFGDRDLQIIPLAAPDSAYLAASRWRSNHFYRSLYLIDIAADSSQHKHCLTNELHTEIVISADQRYLAWGRLHLSSRLNQNAIRYKWYIYDREKKKRHAFPEAFRARHAVFTGDSTIVLAEVHPDGSRLLAYNFRNNVLQTVAESDMPFGRITAHSDQSIILTAQRTNGQRDLFRYDGQSLRALTNDRIDDRRPVMIDENRMIFNRYVDEHPSLALYDFEQDTFYIYLRDQYPYWVDFADTSRNELIVHTWAADRDVQFKRIHLDTLLSNLVSPEKVTFKPRYASWTQKRPTPVHLFDLPDTSLAEVERNRVRFPQKSMEHILSAAFPTVDNEAGAGLYGMTAWAEPLQRQAFAGGFVLFPQDWYRSLVAVNHYLKALNSDWITTLYHGPVLSSFDDGRYYTLYQDIANVQWARSIYLNGRSRWLLRPALDYSVYHHKWVDQLPGAPETFQYHGPGASLQLRYLLPTRFYPVLPKRLWRLSADIFKSIDQHYDFTVYQLGLKLASNLIIEEFGWQGHLDYLKQTGQMPPLKSLGIDRYYQLGIPRDYKFSRVVRGLREDIYGSEMVWTSQNLSWVVKENTGLTILTYPVNNLMLTAFLDYARIDQADKDSDAYGYGGELSFGPSLMRVGLGYAFGHGVERDRTEEAYIRLSFYLPTL